MNYLYATGIVIGGIIAFIGIILYCVWAFFEAEEHDNSWPIAIPAALVSLVLLVLAILVVADKIEG